MSKRICIWGDSIAYGAGDIELGGWVNRLAVYLRKEDRGYRAYNLGVSGNISEEVVERFSAEAKARNPELIIFAVGINDTQYLGKEDRVRVTEEDFTKNINELVKQAKGFTDKIAFVNCNPIDEDKTNPIPWHTNRNYNNERIETNNKIIKDICDKEKLQYIDIHSKFLAKEDYKDLLFDGLHPNEDGHKLIFETVKDNLSL